MTMKTALHVAKLGYQISTHFIYAMNCLLLFLHVRMCQKVRSTCMWWKTGISLYNSFRKLIQIFNDSISLGWNSQDCYETWKVFLKYYPECQFFNVSLKFVWKGTVINTHIVFLILPGALGSSVGRASDSGSRSNGFKTHAGHLVVG